MINKRVRRKLKLNKKQRRQLRKILQPIAVGVMGLIIGVAMMMFSIGRQTPGNLVWAADKEVHVPSDLRKFLEQQDKCRAYRGAGTPTGIGLWGVYQTTKGQFAKIAYGCSWYLSSYIMAVKQHGTWQLLDPGTYFAPFNSGINPSQGALPYCSMIESYKIPSEIESFCIKADGQAQSNPLQKS